MRLQPSETPPWAPEPVMDPAYWRARLETCDGEIHRAMFSGSIRQFAPFNDRHKRILADTIGSTESVFDAGCGYGRILGLMPANWTGDYLGVDISPDFIALARQSYPGRAFEVRDLRDLSGIGQFDWAVVGSMRTMVIRNVGVLAWQAMEREILRVSKRQLHLGFGEYD